MKTKHTPGPWHVGRRFSGGAVYAEKGEEICAFSDLIDPVESLANKRLIAAAPDLLDALAWALKNLEEVAIPLANKHGRVTSMTECVVQARAALAKAEGGA